MKHITILTFFSLILQADPWHPEITHRPRVLYTSTQENEVKSRIGISPYDILWYNNFNTNLDRCIYTNASRNQQVIENTFENPRDFTDERSKIAKDAAFVYAINKRANGVDDLNNYIDAENPWTRDQYKDHAIDYLENLNWWVFGPATLYDFQELAPYVNNWQHRSEELIYYCQAYDLLLGAGVPENVVIEENIRSFANNLLNHYQEHTFIPEFIFRRNNHKLIFAAAIGMAAVTLNNDPIADYWINAAIVIIEWVLFADPETSIDGFRQIDADGGYAEGPGYMRYAWRKLLPFFVAMKNFNGNWSETYSNTNLYNFYPFNSSLASINVTSPLYDTRYTPIYDFITKIRTPEGRLPSLEDSSLRTYFPELALLGGYYSWPYEPYESNDSKENILSRSLGSLRADYICAGNANEQSSPAEWGNVQYFPNAGSVVFRSDWSTDAIYLHLNGKNGNVRRAGEAHDQADVSSFTLGYKGKLLIMDGGYSGYQHRYKNNRAKNHNVVVLDDSVGASPPLGPSFISNIDIGWLEGIFGGIEIPLLPIPNINIDLYFSPSLTDGYFQNYITNEKFSYVEVRSNYGRKYSRYIEFESEEFLDQEVWLPDEDDDTSVDFTRGVLFIGNRYFIVLDDVDNQEQELRDYTWLLHCNGGGETNGQFQSTANGGIISQEGVNLLSYTTAIGSLDEITFEESKHADGAGLDNLKNHTLIKAKKNAIDTQYLSVLYPYENTSPSIFEISTSNYTGLIVDRTTTVENRYEVIVSQNQGNSINIPSQTIGQLLIPSIQTDAEFFVVSLDGTNPTDIYSMQFFSEGSNAVEVNGITIILPGYGVDNNTVFNGEYFTSSDLIITNGSSLTIEEGSTIHFGSGAKMYVENLSSLNIQGTVSDKVTFTSTGSENWEGIFVKNDAELNIENAVILNANVGITFDFWDNVTNDPPDKHINSVEFEDTETGVLIELKNHANFVESNIYVDQCKFTNSINGIKYSQNEQNGPVPFNDQINTYITNSSFMNSDVGIELNRNAEIVDISNCVFDNNTRGISIDLEWPASEQITHNFSVGRNLFTNNVYGISIIADCFSGDLDIYNNTFDNNQHGVIRTLVNGLFQCTAYNNIVANGQIGIFLDLDEDINFNDFYNLQTNSYPTGGTGNIEADPNFVDPLNGDYHISYPSPVYNAGDPNSPYDPDGTIADMGVYYVDGPPSAPMGFSISGSSGQHPTCSWSPNSELDLDGYKLYKKEASSSWGLFRTLSENTTSYTDNSVTIGPGGKFSTNVCYKVSAFDFTGLESSYSILRCKPLGSVSKEMEIIPDEYALQAAFPNPFNPTTTIRFDLPERSRVTMVIYDVLGRTIKTLIHGNMEPGFHEILWDGKDDKGNPVSTGMYIYRFYAFSEESETQFARSQKMVLMK